MSGCEHLRDDEAGFENLLCLVLIRRGVCILHIKPQVSQGLFRLADLGVGVTCMVRAVENV